MDCEKWNGTQSRRSAKFIFLREQSTQRGAFSSVFFAFSLRSCFEFLQKVFLGLMYPFSCVLWAIFWPFSLLSPLSSAIFLITEAKMPQKLIPNHRTINSKQLLNYSSASLHLCVRFFRKPILFYYNMISGLF